jgi:hypothetical protein
MATATIGLSTPLSAPAKAPASAPRKGLFMRLMEAMMVARLRQAERELSMYRHLFPEGKVGPLPDPVPHDEVKQAGYKATYADAGLLPFVR